MVQILCTNLFLEKNVSYPSLYYCCEGAGLEFALYSTASSTVITGDQVLNIARAKAKENQARLERDIQKKKEQIKLTSSVTVVADVQIKEEPMSDDESMDTSAYESFNNGMVNGVHADENSEESMNGDKDPVAKELMDFVESTFRRQYVLTMSELKRLFNLHLASLPPGHTLFSGISDKMLHETVLYTGCKQIMVPVSIFQQFLGLPALSLFFFMFF